MIENKEDIIEQVEQSLETIRPYLKTDGGDVKVVKVTDDGVVQVELLGACKTCPQSFMTMKAGIEESIKKAVNGITAVEAI